MFSLFCVRKSDIIFIYFLLLILLIRRPDRKLCHPEWSRRVSANKIIGFNYAQPDN